MQERRRDNPQTTAAVDGRRAGFVAPGEPQTADRLASRLLAVALSGYERRAQLEHALRARIVIEQAKGVLAERLAVSVEEAFDLLRAAARTHRRTVTDLAQSVVRSRLTPPELARGARLVARRPNAAREATLDRGESP